MTDTTDSRKIHTVTASRLGGLSFFPAILLSVCLCLSFFLLYNKEFPFSENTASSFALDFCALFILYMLGVTDDMIGVRYRRKFLFQILAAILIIISGTWITNLHGFFGIREIPDSLGIPLTIFLLVFITNSINLIDGIDGLASLLSILALCVYGIIFLEQTSLMDVLIAFACIGALLPFFYFNVFKVRKKSDSKIFMGDTGSLVIGFILGVMAVKLWNMNTPGDQNVYPYMLGYTMLIVPCFDTVRVICYRIKERRPVFFPDNNHIHHKLIKLGLSHRKTLTILVLMQIFLLILNVLLAKILNITFIVMIDIFCMFLFIKIMNKTLTKT